MVSTAVSVAAGLAAAGLAAVAFRAGFAAGLAAAAFAAVGFAAGLAAAAFAGVGFAAALAGAALAAPVARVVRGAAVDDPAAALRVPVVLFAGVLVALAVRAVLRAGVVWEVLDCVFPERGVGTLSGAFSPVAAAGVRVFPWAGAGIRRVPLRGAESSARGRSWWSELMHLTSVDGHCTTRSRGEERCPCKHVVMFS